MLTRAAGRCADVSAFPQPTGRCHTRGVYAGPIVHVACEFVVTLLHHGDVRALPALLTVLIARAGGPVKDTSPTAGTVTGGGSAFGGGVRA
jgi:hypothetical protein